MPHVVVVGAGPAGLTLALLLARSGIAVTLVDPGDRTTGAPRGDALMPSGLAALERIGLAAQLAALPRRPLQAWSVLLQGRPLFSVAEPIGGGSPCTLIDSDALLALLHEQAGRHPGFRLQRGNAVDLLSAGGGGTGSPQEARIVGVTLADGTRLAADLVVACDGRSSLLRRRAGLELEEEARAVRVAWFALEGQGTSELQRWIDGRFVTLLGDGGSLALFSTARGAVRLGHLSDGAEARSGDAGKVDWRERWARSSPDDLARLWRSLPAGCLPAPLRLSVRPGLAPRWERPGLLLLGDAAHPMSPVRAQGLNMALRDAVLAAERLSPVLQQAGREAAARADGSGWRARLDATLRQVASLRQTEVRAVQTLQRQELARGELLRDTAWLRRLLAASAPWSGPLLARRWLAGQPILRNGLPWP